MSCLRRAIRKGCAAGWALHNKKASSMLCLMDKSKLPHSKLPAKDIVGSDCYGYANIVSQSVCEDISISSQHTFLDTYVIRRGQTLYLVHW